MVRKTLIILCILITMAGTAVAHAQSSSLSSFPSASVPSWLDTGSNSWMLTAATFVGLQSVPGVALYYAGLSKKRYAINSAMMVFYAFAAVLVVWMLAGYNFGFGEPTFRIGPYAIFGTPTPAMGEYSWVPRGRTVHRPLPSTSRTRP
ncbi:hypothetical protein HS1genome_1555 [Sulfodiicoccus acidiphilus]|uniref:Ammonium transporter AmtB-like domain-containing protein n=1 Tax=Sulfodiicoccus acidiphilus TaxID=1670455 RepID=A0A348B4R4_9CREN|nr:hypothetical protein HS1genome_1555 [Sulfodiicoccus acidiphilus]